MQIPTEHAETNKKPDDPDYDRHKQWQESIEVARAAARAQDKSLATAEIPAETKMKIRDKFTELALKHPGWSRDKIMGKAGKAYGIKFEFE